ncbi:MAG: ABC transporter ATP-binding protein [Candidatus Dojkabacteria bacterium]
MLQVKNVIKTYGKRDNVFNALNGVSFEVQEGETVAIIGKSGSGKSTLMHIIAGLDKPTSGSVTFMDQPIESMNAKQLAKLRNEQFGFVFQQFFMQPQLSSLHNVSLPLKIRGMDKSTRAQKAQQALQDVELSDKAKNKGTNLSGGQKQRVCIARAIVTEPRVLFADEPTGNLDSETGEKITELLFKLNKEKGITLIIVTHDEELASLCNRKIYIKDGKIERMEGGKKK